MKRGQRNPGQNPPSWVITKPQLPTLILPASAQGPENGQKDRALPRWTFLIYHRRANRNSSRIFCSFTILLILRKIISVAIRFTNKCSITGLNNSWMGNSSALRPSLLSLSPSSSPSLSPESSPSSPWSLLSSPTSSPFSPSSPSPSPSD